MSRILPHELFDIPTRPYACRVGSPAVAGASGSSLFAPPPPGPTVGARLGHYRLCFELGFGGMATVFLARVEGRAGLHRFVALKCLHPDLARQPRFAEMFLNEARIASQVGHSNVCSVLDFDVRDGVSYMAMEYLAGEPMSAVRTAMSLDSDSWPEAHRAGLAARMIADACEGLHAAHELQTIAGEPLDVVHRDVSPDNIFVTYDGNVKIVDFGVALSAARHCRTRTGVVRGKFAYLQPEVLRGSKADRRADVWSLGVVLWELLTGRRLFEGESDVDVLRAVSEQKIPTPSSIRQGIPEALDEVVLKALRRDPRKRYATAREFGRKLNQFLADQRMAIGLAELSEGMDKMFPEGRARKRQLLEVAEQIDSGSTMRTLHELRSNSLLAATNFSAAAAQLSQPAVGSAAEQPAEGRSSTVGDAGPSVPSSIEPPAYRSLRQRASGHAAAALRVVSSSFGRERNWKFWLLSGASAAAAATALVLWTIAAPAQPISGGSGARSSTPHALERAAFGASDEERDENPSSSARSTASEPGSAGATLPLVLSGAGRTQRQHYLLRVRPVAAQADADEPQLQLKLEIVPDPSASSEPRQAGGGSSSLDRAGGVAGR